jgi:uncharacterized membrane protein HdeD (DUF308 family)
MANAVSYSRRDAEDVGTWALAEGVALMIVGLVAIFARYTTVDRLVLALALYLVVKGILEVVAAFRADVREGTRYDLAYGIIAILAGVLVMTREALSISTWAIIVGYFLLEGIARLALGYRTRGEDTGWVWVIGMGVIDLILFVYLLITPTTPLSTIAVLAGINILAAGIVMAVVGWMERTHRIHAGVTPA